MGSSGPAGTRPRGLGQFTQMLPPAPRKNECAGQRVACVRAGFELSVNECACAHMCVRARVRRRGCRGGCRRGSFVEPLASSEPACRLPWLVPRGHLALLPSPYTSLSPATAPTFLGGRPAPAFRCWKLPAGWRLPGLRGPAQVKVSAAAPMLALKGGREEGLSWKGRAALCSWRWEQPGLQHCYLRQRPRPAPRRPAPSRPRAALTAVTQEEATALGDRGRRGERSARWERRPRVSESHGPGRAIAAQGHPGTEPPRLRRAGGGDPSGPRH